MPTTRAALTKADIDALARAETPDERAAATVRICKAVDAASLDAQARTTAQDILRVLAADAAEVVRRALAVTLKASPLVPSDVALRLARDVESVSLPMLAESPVFTDAELAEIVRLGGPVRQLVIARRPLVGEKVTAALARHGDARAVSAACANEGAAFAENTLQQVLQRFERSEQVLAAMAYRQALPLAVSEKLVELVGEELRAQLIARGAVSKANAEALMERVRERGTVDLLDQAREADDLKAFVAHLNRKGRLSASLLLRALAQGQIGFFEWGLAELAAVPHHRTWLMVHDAGPLGLRAVYERAGLPARLYPAFRAGVDTFHALEAEGGAMDAKVLQERMLQRFLTQPQAALRADIDYLLERLDRPSATDMPRARAARSA